MPEEEENAAVFEGAREVLAADGFASEQRNNDRLITDDDGAFIGVEVNSLVVVVLDGDFDLANRYGSRGFAERIQGPLSGRVLTS